MHFRLLGPLEVTDGDHPVPLGSARQRSVLVLLLLHRNVVVSSERLIDQLWGESPPPTAPKVLQNYVGSLRRALEDRDGRRLQTHGRGYVLRVEHGELDVDRFEQLSREGGQALGDGRPDAAAARLREALALWRGRPLADVAYEPFAQAEVRRLEEQHAAALERRIEADLCLGRHADLVGELEGLVARHPLRERLRGHQMLALYRAGRQADALDAFRQARRALVDEVGVEPGTDLRHLHEAILRQDPALDLPSAELAPELDVSGWPALAGRGRELGSLLERWRAVMAGVGEAVVLTGPPGIGRTRLAAELAVRLHQDGAAVHHAAGDQGSRAVLAAVARAEAAARPALVVLDDADRCELPADAFGTLAERPVLVVLTARDPDRVGHLGVRAELALEPLDRDAVTGILASYAPGAANDGAAAERLLHESGGVPRRIHELAANWAARAAARRVGELAPRAAAGRAALRRTEAGLTDGVLELQDARERLHRLLAPGDPVVCPYKGLASFQFDDAAYFCGREQLVAELVARAVGAPLLAVVGPSGIGKSSLVRAGLLPAFATGVLPGSAEWPRTVVRPGEHPAGRFAADVPGVVAVDQLEELFTACRDERERSAFVAAVVRRAHEQDAEGPVILAVRADFYGRFAAYPELARLLAANHVLVGPMDARELHRAIEGPAERAGLQLDPGLADELVADVAGEPGALPLLSTALLELWQQRDGRVLRHAVYERTGGVRGAVARMAEAAYAVLEPEQRRTARAVLLRLADTGPGDEVVRRRVARQDLERSGGDVPAVLDVLADRRLVTVSAATVEVAHEALLREWPRLRTWLDEDAHNRRVRRHLTHAAAEWDERGRDPGELYRGSRLALALEWRAGHADELSPAERAFLDAGRAHAGRTQRRLRLGLAAAAALLAATAVSAVLALQQGREARREARAAEGQRLSAQALTETAPDRALLLARQAVALEDSAFTRGNLLGALLRRPTVMRVVRGEGDPVTALDVATDGRTLAVGDRQGGLALVDAVSRRALGPAVRLGGPVVQVRLSPDGSRLAVVHEDAGGPGVLTLFEVPTLRRLPPLRTGAPTAYIDVRDPVFSPDGRVLAVDVTLGGGTQSSYKRVVVRWEMPAGRRLQPVRATTGFVRITVPPHRSATLATFARRGRVLVTSSAEEDVTVVRHADRLRPLTRVSHGGEPVAASADGRWLALRGRGLALALLDLQTGAHRPLGGRVTAAAFTPDGRRLVTVDAEGDLVTWDHLRAAPVRKVATGERVVQLVVGADRTVYAGSEDGSVVGWDLDGRPRLARPFEATAGRATALAPAGGRSPLFAVGGSDGTVAVLDATTLEAVRRMRFGSRMPADPRGSVLVLDPRAHTMAVGTSRGGVGFADLRTGKVLSTPGSTHVNPVRHLAFSADGRWLASTDGTVVYLWDVRRGKPVGVYQGVVGRATAMAFSPDDRTLVMVDVHPGEKGVLDVLRPPQLRLVEQVPASAAVAMRYSRDGRTLFHGDDAGRVWRLDTRTWRPRGSPLPGRPDPGPFALSPDERTLASTSGDGTTQLWDVPSGRPLGTALPGAAGRPVRAAFVSGGAALVTLHDDGRGRVWDVRPSSWVRSACAIAGRTLTRGEWRQALPGWRYAPACRRPAPDPSLASDP